MRVLIVDDEPIVRESMSELLPWKEMGFETVLCARDAYDAQKELELERIDVLISDIEMPGMDGLALSKWVHERFPRTINLSCLILIRTKCDPIWCNGLSS